MKKLQVGIAAMLCLLALPAIVTATVVRHMNIDALVDSSGTIFRGTVTAINIGTVEVGGAELPTTTYAFRVDEMFKGQPTTVKDGVGYMTITMIGSPKVDDQTGDVRLMSAIREIPEMRTGSEYLLFTTRESSVGLSVPVGLAQGCFDIIGDMALNRADNLGLFNGTSFQGPASGEIEYRELADRIRQSLGTS